jgi:Polysaccharide deacetylase
LINALDIGSNVVGFPAAAQRAVEDGLTICVHTWSHPQMTTLSNDMIVAELYWTLRSIKESAGVTPRCWRPPYGDVDDRVRAIAWQMGMRTIIWDEDTNDWNMPGDGGGNLSPATVDGYFQGWIDAYKNGTDNTSGHIVLEHELNNATVSMAEKWLPTLQETFNVVPVHDCMGIPNPYWEDNFIFPTENGTASSSSAAADPSTTTDPSDALSTAPPPASETSNEDSAMNANTTADGVSTSGSSVTTVGCVSALITAFLAVCLM